MRPVQGNFPEQDSALAVVQIDHTRANIEVVDDDERLPLGRPWITLAIDVFTRIVVGIYVTMDAPSAVSVGMCICNAILPKRAYLVELGVAGEWPVSGLPGTIHSDNGKDFRSNAVKRACDEYKVTHDFRPVATPHWGGHIERLMKTTNSEIHNLPGTTFSNPKDRDSYDSSKHAAMTVREFEAYLVDWIVNKYNLGFHRGIDAAPLAKFKRSILGSPDKPGIGLGPIPEEAKLRMDFLPFTRKVVRREGVVVHHVWYWDEVLKPRLEQNERDDLKQKPKDLFRFDPRDMSVIYFWDPETSTYYPIPYKDAGKPPMSRYELDRAKKQAKEDGVAHIDEQVLFETANRLRQRARDAVKTTKTVRKQKRQIAQTEKLAGERRKAMAEAPAPSRDPERATTLIIDDPFDGPVKAFRVTSVGTQPSGE